MNKHLRRRWRERILAIAVLISGYGAQINLQKLGEFVGDMQGDFHARHPIPADGPGSNFGRNVLMSSSFL